MEKCNICKGKGTITCLAPEGIKAKYYTEICKNCFGTGYVTNLKENKTKYH